jgi:type II secretory pathway component GspD/PulD (secretin)
MRACVFLVFAASVYGGMIASTGAGADELRIIQLKHRTAQDVMPLVQPLLGPNDAISAVDYRLILRTSAKQFGEIQRVVQQLDIARRNLTITVTQSVSSNAAQAEQEISARARFGRDVQILLPPQRAGGGTVTITRSDPNSTGAVQYRAKQTDSSGANNNTQTLRVLDGQRAFIRIGHSTPQLSRILAQAGRQDLTAGGIEYHDVTTGFEVVPRVNGNSVVLEITPRLSTTRDSSSTVASFQELSTTVVTRLGEWINLGDIVASRHEVNRTILSDAEESAGERRSVMLKVE